MFELHLGTVFWLEIEYEDDPSVSKRRPVIVIDETEDEVVILISTTSQGPKEPPKTYDNYKIPILNWRLAGLKKPSWGLGLRLLSLSKSSLQSTVERQDYIGNLIVEDFNYLIMEIEKIHSN